ncbi:hypothetical protein BGZ73_005127 [Actinomortierella ambigua]|nr:hypothetical protein BGZ73_005127 [Actinomortierella ambigua]
MAPPVIPIECIQLILDHVDHTTGLHTLLFLNKSWFPVVAARLYRDPLTRIGSSQNTPRALSLFLSRVVLCYTPSEDPIVLAIKHNLALEYSTPLPPSTAYTKPSLDYLSYIRVIRFNSRVTCSLPRLKPSLGSVSEGSDHHQLNSPIFRPETGADSRGKGAQEDQGHCILSDFLPLEPLDTRNAAAQQAIILAIASNRFHKLDELQIPLRYLSQFYRQPSIIRALAGLQCIVFDLGGFRRCSHETVQSTYDFVQTYLEIHGPQHGLTDVVYVGGRLAEQSQSMQVIYQVYGLLGSHYMPKLITDYNVEYDGLDRLDRVQAIHLASKSSRAAAQAMMARLEKCHRLQELRVVIECRTNSTVMNPVHSGNEDDFGHIFHWAINNPRAPWNGTTYIQQPLPPLRVVDLSYNGHHSEKLVDHLFAAFGSSLEDVRLRFTSLSGRTGYIGCNQPPWRCPQLRRFQIFSRGLLLMAPEVLTGHFPRLERLHLRDTSETLLPVPPGLYNPWPHMPELIHLFLEGRAATQFSLVSLCYMSKLQWLAIRCRPFSSHGAYDSSDDYGIVTRWMMTMPNPWPESRIQHAFQLQKTPKQARPQQRCKEGGPERDEPIAGINGEFATVDRETWRLPALKVMEIRGPPASTIPLLPSSYLATHFPRLESLILSLYPVIRSLDNDLEEHCCEEASVSPSADSTLRRHDQHHLQCRHQQLRVLTLEGSWTIHLPALRQLLWGFPKICSLAFKGMTSSSYHVRPIDMVQATAPSTSSSYKHGAARPAPSTKSKASSGSTDMTELHVWHSDDITPKDAISWGLEEYFNHGSPLPPLHYSCSFPPSRESSYNSDVERDAEGDIYFHFGSSTYHRRRCPELLVPGLAKAIVAAVKEKAREGLALVTFRKKANKE